MTRTWTLKKKLSVAPEPYQQYTLSNLRAIPQLSSIDPEIIEEIEIVGSVFPFKTNNYVVNELIDWSKAPEDPIFTLNFPQRGMLNDEQYARLKLAHKAADSSEHVRSLVHEIWHELNPHPAGQLAHNTPRMLDGTPVRGLQHKYRDTVLVFPSQGQTCHAYCTFCFRWPQFVGMDEYKIAIREAEQLVAYLSEHPEVTDVLFTGGDPMVMKARVFAKYVDALLAADLPNLQTIRIGSKSLSYWPAKFTVDSDAEHMLRLFERITEHGLHLSFMAHVNHGVELSTDTVKEAISRIRSTGAVIRTQSPIMRGINDSADVWASMWTAQVNLGCIPYYMFIARDTGAQDFFAVPLVTSHQIFQQAFRSVGGLARTVRGPSMSALPGKVQIIGITEIRDEPVMVLQFLRARDTSWVNKPFFAKYDPAAIWLDDLKPISGDTFFYEEQLQNMLSQESSATRSSVLHS